MKSNSRKIKTIPVVYLGIFLINIWNYSIILYWIYCNLYNFKKLSWKQKLKMGKVLNLLSLLWRTPAIKDRNLMWMLRLQEVKWYLINNQVVLHSPFISFPCFLFHFLYTSRIVVILVIRINCIFTNKIIWTNYCSYKFLNDSNFLNWE